MFGENDKYNKFYKCHIWFKSLASAIVTCQHLLHFLLLPQSHVWLAGTFSLMTLLPRLQWQADTEIHAHRSGPCGSAIHVTQNLPKIVQLGLEEESPLLFFWGTVVVNENANSLREKTGNLKTTEVRGGVQMGLESLAAVIPKALSISALAVVWLCYSINSTFCLRHPESMLHCL